MIVNSENGFGYEDVFIPDSFITDEKSTTVNVTGIEIVLIRFLIQI